MLLIENDGNVDDFYNFPQCNEFVMLFTLNC